MTKDYEGHFKIHKSITIVHPMTKVRFVGTSEAGSSFELFAGKEIYILNELFIDDVVEGSVRQPVNTVEVNEEFKVETDNKFGLFQVHQLLERSVRKEESRGNYTKGLSLTPILVLLDSEEYFCALIVSFARIADNVLVVESRDEVFEFEFLSTDYLTVFRQAGI